MNRFYRCHPRLKAGSSGPMANRNPLHLRQSDLDGACGTHCALMALMVFGLVKHDELAELTQVRKKPLAKLWKLTASHYFVGIRPSHLKSAFLPYRNSITCQILKGDRVNQAITTLGADGLCIVGIDHADFSHWVLAIGWGGKEGDDNAKTLLILDPDASPLPLVAWNGILSVKSNRHGQHRYETARSCVNVSIGSVLALKHAKVE